MLDPCRADILMDVSLLWSWSNSLCVAERWQQFLKNLSKRYQREFCTVSFAMTGKRVEDPAGADALSHEATNVLFGGVKSNCQVWELVAIKVFKGRAVAKVRK